MPPKPPEAAPRILVIAGSDSSGGAGIQADIKTISLLGGHAMTAITAITAQNTLGVQGVETVSPAMVAAQARSCLDDIGVDAVKIGMLGSAAIAHAVADILETVDCPIVFDPVMVATSGSALADSETIAAFERLMDRAMLTTPNAPELVALGGPDTLSTRGIAYLAKGGHDGGEMVTDTLHLPGVEPVSWRAPRIHTRHTHGTGCTLASAIATGIGAGMDLPDAIARARAFVRAALLAAPALGRGAGPLGQGRVDVSALAAEYPQC